MTDFLTHLLQRSLGAAAMVEPMTPSRFAGSGGLGSVEDAGEGIFADVTQTTHVDDTQAGQASGIASPRSTQYKMEVLQRKAVTGPLFSRSSIPSSSDTMAPATVSQSPPLQPGPQDVVSHRAGETQARADSMATQPPVATTPASERHFRLGPAREAVQAGEFNRRAGERMLQQPSQARQASVEGDAQEKPLFMPPPNNESQATQTAPQGERELPHGRLSPLPIREMHHGTPALPANPMSQSTRASQEAAHSGNEPLSPRIEVTIGRIEVRAQVAPQPQSLRPQHRTPSLSLADYLESRNGGGK